jgi:hypothetical protein
MMRIIYKYPINVVGPTEIKVPLGSRVLSAQLQGQALMVWVEQPDVDLIINTLETIVFLCIMTGHPKSDELFEHFTFLSTVQIGGFVLHVYYEVTS